MLLRSPAPLLPIALLVLAACAAAPGAPPAWLAPPDVAKKDVASGMALERFFPLVDGNVYSYTTENETGDQGFLVARAVRTDPLHGELRFPRGAKRFTYARDGVVLEDASGSTYVLKAPLDVRASWRGEHGGTTSVLEISAAVDVPAGHFEGCVRTQEERGGDRPARFATTFCPGVGVVLLEASSGVSIERAALKSYGTPQALGPDGIDKFTVTPPSSVKP